jgi:hypothetical protein
MGESELDRTAWIDLVSEAFAWRDHGLFFAEPRLADPTRAAFVAGMSDIEVADAISAGRPGWDLGEVLAYVASIRENRNVGVQLIESTVQWLWGDES